MLTHEYIYRAASFLQIYLTFIAESVTTWQVVNSILNFIFRMTKVCRKITQEPLDNKRSWNQANPPSMQRLIGQ